MKRNGIVLVCLALLTWWSFTILNPVSRSTDQRLFGFILAVYRQLNYHSLGKCGCYLFSRVSLYCAITAHGALNYHPRILKKYCIFVKFLKGIDCIRTMIQYDVRVYYLTCNQQLKSRQLNGMSDGQTLVSFMNLLKLLTINRLIINC